MKKVLGLDLGTASIGWSFVIEDEKNTNNSRIVNSGVRIIPLDSAVRTDFSKGNNVSLNAERTMKRGARRNRDRYQLRRSKLMSVLKREDWLKDESVTILENDTHEAYRIRAKSARERISLHELGLVLLMINKKRGYQSMRKLQGDESGTLINELDIALELSNQGITPGEYAYKLLSEGQKRLPQFYRSDLKNELDTLWMKYEDIYPEIINCTTKQELKGKSKSSTTKYFYAKYGVDTKKQDAKNKRLQAYEWRVKAAKEKVELDLLCFALAEINGNISNSSGYLGAIGDRSKILHMHEITVGEYLHQQLVDEPHRGIKNEIFYRQDYQDEFDTIWRCQAQYHTELNDTLRQEIRDRTIFYQRPLKSQKSNIAFCALEFSEKRIEVKGKVKDVKIGSKVIPRSSPLFQYFKCWSEIQNLVFSHKDSGDSVILEQEDKQQIYDALITQKQLSKSKLLKLLFGKEAKHYTCNYEEVDGNHTTCQYLDRVEAILAYEGNEISFATKSIEESKDILGDYFGVDHILVKAIDFDPTTIEGRIEQSEVYLFWHTVYSYEADESRSGLECLIKLLKEKYGFSSDHAEIFAQINLLDDYGHLSAKAIKKLIPYIKENNYSEACKHAGYKHSGSLTKPENQERTLDDQLQILIKNSLRNPIVEKILNQMIHVVNSIMKDERMGRPDIIKIELARELKKNARQRSEMTSSINAAKKRHENIKNIIRKAPYNLANPTRNDVIKYKLYEELAFNGYKDVYTNTKIEPWELFTKKIDVEHIIPKALMFDDSYSNKTLCPHDFNAQVKGNLTAYDCMQSRRANDMENYLHRIEDGKARGMTKNSTNGFSMAKYYKLLKRAEDLGEGFLERDLRNSQYIARQAMQILKKVCREVMPTQGSVTNRLREDWDLVNMMKEINLPKYRALGLTEMEDRKYDQKVEVIQDWTKRNDHRHHAIDAIIVAFTKHGHIQYLNNLSASSAQDVRFGNLKAKYTQVVNGKRVIVSPMTHMRSRVKKSIEQILISFKASNKVVTKNINKIKIGEGTKSQVTLTPRGPLHQETVYGKSLYYEKDMATIGGKMTLEVIAKIANAEIRKALLNRLEANENNPKKAFTGKNSPSKTPIYLPDGTEVPNKVKIVWLQDRYTKREEITPDLNIDKVIDKGVKRILESRLAEYGGDPKKAFADLDTHPIWIDKVKGSSLKHVTITGKKNATPLHPKMDHHGKPILVGGKSVPNDYVSLGNNHHVAIYRDEKGKLQEQTISLFEAVARATAPTPIPIIDKTYNEESGWEYLFSIKENEMFVFPSESFDPREIDLLDPENASIISPHLFRNQTISTKDYWFRHHLETTLDMNIKGVTYHRIRNPKKLKDVVKVRIDHLGKIVHVGEY